MRTLVIVNPRATAVNSRKSDTIIRTMREIMRTEVVDTAHRGHATALARRAMRDHSADVVIGMGGDGTVNEIVNGLLGDGPHDSVPAFGVVPAGATNVFARSLGFPNDAQVAVARLQHSLRHGLYREINLGCVNGRYFLFSAGIGLDAAIIEEVERWRSVGRRSTLSVTAAAATRHFFCSTWPALSLHRPNGTTVDGLRWIIVTKTDTWTFLNELPLRPTPRASFELGMDIYARYRMGPFGLLRSAVQFLRQTPRNKDSGTYLEHDVDEFTVDADRLAPVHVDGDVLGRHSELHFTCVSRGLRVLSPAPCTSRGATP